MSGQELPAGRVVFGTAGWSYPDWNGRVYARAGKGGLELLASVFDLAEVNTTYYRIPGPDLARGWIRQVSHHPTFSFAVKAWSGFTHQRNGGASDVKAFVAAIEPLRSASRLAAILFQFPWSFRRDEGSDAFVARLLADFSEMPLAVEFRHSSWDHPGVREALAARGVSWVNIDQPMFPDSLAPSEYVTAAMSYVRLHGRNHADWFRAAASRDQRYNYCYSLDELEPWVERIRSLARRSREVLVVTNNHFQGQAVVNALELKSLVDQRAPIVPTAWIAAFPRLAGRCRPDSAAQGELFH